MYSYGSPHTAAQKQDDQHERTFSSCVRIQDVVLKTCLGRCYFWTLLFIIYYLFIISLLSIYHLYLLFIHIYYLFIIYSLFIICLFLSIIYFYYLFHYSFVIYYLFIFYLLFISIIYLLFIRYLLFVYFYQLFISIIYILFIRYLLFVYFLSIIYFYYLFIIYSLFIICLFLSIIYFYYLYIIYSLFIICLFLMYYLFLLFIYYLFVIDYSFIFYLLFIHYLFHYLFVIDYSFIFIYYLFIIYFIIYSLLIIRLFFIYYLFIIYFIIYSLLIIRLFLSIIYSLFISLFIFIIPVHNSYLFINFWVCLLICSFIYFIFRALFCSFKFQSLLFFSFLQVFRLVMIEQRESVCVSKQEYQDIYLKLDLYFYKFSMLFLLPMSLACLLNGMVVYKMCLLPQLIESEHLSSAVWVTRMHRRKNKTSIMLIIVSLTYIVTMCPAAVTSFYIDISLRRYGKSQVNYIRKLMPVFSSFEVISQLNYAINFYIYIMSDKSYRVELKRIFHGEKRNSLSVSRTRMEQVTLWVSWVTFRCFLFNGIRILLYFLWLFGGGDWVWSVRIKHCPVSVVNFCNKRKNISVQSPNLILSISSNIRCILKKLEKAHDPRLISKYILDSRKTEFKKGTKNWFFKKDWLIDIISGVILCHEARELHSLYVHVNIFCVVVS